MTRNLTVRRGAYVDSVTLMQVSQQISSLPGVRSALVAMATELNLDLATSMGFTLPEHTSPNEMLVAVEADDDASLDAALAQVDVALTAKASPSSLSLGGAPAPLTVRAAARAAESGVALISTPGQYAFLDAVDAIDAGLHTMVFSDNVPLAQEVALKRYAEPRGVLVMGPDCGTAVVGGVGLGFANVVRPGPVGIIAASGTGAQHLMTLLDGVHVGISHCLGVGGRDLASAVGGASTMRALDLLASDDQTKVIVVISKPPDEDVADSVRKHAASTGKPMIFGLLGVGQPDLTATAAHVAETLGLSWSSPGHLDGQVDCARSGGSLRGLFAGGTLCDEAMIITSSALGTIRSNIPLEPSWGLEESLASDGHTMIDFGDDRLTQGRPHPMIDGSIRAERMRAEIEDPTCGVLLLDVVLGLGAAPDPAAELAPLVEAASAAGVPVVVSVVGTNDDPQGRAGQASVLNAAGAWVFFSNAEAARHAIELLAKESDA
ncbi:MAG TPA: FdrA family protein [Nocardioidaceae bacterium]|nr:FdrA family protein [Nocardioidaceae bacterium]